MFNGPEKGNKNNAKMMRHKQRSFVALATTVITITYALNYNRISIIANNMVRESNGTHELQAQMTADERTIDTQKNGALCLVTNPDLHKDEIESNSFVSASGHYCVDGNKTFKVNFNFNIERSVRFGPYFRRQTSMNQFSKTGALFKANNIKDGIPTIFHFIWSGAIVPGVFVNNLKRFRMLHPNWEIHFWTIAHGRTIIQKIEPHILAAYNGYKSDTSRADALRYVLMYHYGGVYLDLDIHPKQPFDNLTMLDDCLIGPEPVEHTFFEVNFRSMLSNAVLFCKPKHPFYRYVLDQLPLHAINGGILGIAGPVFLSRIFNTFISLQFHENRSINHDETFKISFIRHEYFEFLVQAATLPKIKKHCNPIMTNVEYFITHCLKKEADSKNCTQLIRKKDSRENAMFEACVEWASHGKEKRDIVSSVVYAHHMHYATRDRLRSLKFIQENNITRLLPNAIVHL